MMVLYSMYRSSTPDVNRDCKAEVKYFTIYLTLMRPRTASLRRDDAIWWTLFLLIVFQGPVHSSRTEVKYSIQYCGYNVHIVAYEYLQTRIARWRCRNQDRALHMELIKTYSNIPVAKS